MAISIAVAALPCHIHYCQFVLNVVAATGVGVAACAADGSVQPSPGDVHFLLLSYTGAGAQA